MSSFLSVITWHIGCDMSFKEAGGNRKIFKVTNQMARAVEDYKCIEI
jgi:hypothetical protein